MKQLFLILCLSFLMLPLSCHADDDDFARYEAINIPWLNQINNKDVKIPTVKFTQYNITCGKCHFAYQPSLLPQQGWKQTLQSQQHFGKQLMLSDIQLRTMRRYVIDNSANHIKNHIANQISLSLKYHETDGRITTSPFFTLIPTQKAEYNKNNYQYSHITFIESCYTNDYFF